MTQNEGGDRWAELLVRRVGLAIKKARGNKSARWLSDGTAALGYRVSPTVIAKLDSGHRGSVLSVAELLVLAAALDIPPGLLLFPGYPYGQAEFLPGRTAHAQSAVEWFAGDGRLPAGPDGKTPRATPPNAGTELVSLAQRWDEAGRMFLYLEGGGQMTDAAGDRRLEERLRAQLTDLQAQIDHLSPTFEIEETPR
jgi:hypothetical protein